MSTLKGEGKENVSSLDKFVNHESPGNFCVKLSTRLYEVRNSKNCEVINLCFMPMDVCPILSNNP